MTDLGTFEGQDINNAGQIAGSVVSGGGASRRAALWDSGRITELGTLGGELSDAFAINDLGQIVGYARTADGEYHAFLWQNGEMVDLGTFGGDGAGAIGINSAGQIVGQSQTQNQSRTVIWQEGSFSELAVPVGMQSLAHDINESGEVVGVVFPVGSDPSGNIVQPVKWGSIKVR